MLFRSGLKSLAKETAIYGVSSIVGRFLNYLLVPVYTIALPASSGGYGVVTNIYAWVALILVLLTCGMEYVSGNLLLSGTVRILLLRSQHPHPMP